MAGEAHVKPGRSAQVELLTFNKAVRKALHRKDVFLGKGRGGEKVVSHPTKDVGVPIDIYICCMHKESSRFARMFELCICCRSCLSHLSFHIF